MNRYFFILIILLFGCRNTSTEEKGTFEIDWKKSEKIKNAYAKGFSIEKFKDYYRITIIDPQAGTVYGKYVLYPEKDEKPVLAEGEIGILYPVRTVTSVSTTHLPFLKLLKEEKSLVGYAGQKFVLDPDFKKLFTEKNIPELGSDNQLDHEKIIELSPDLLMVYPFGALNFKKIEKAGIPVFYNTEYLELHPLGKAEWIKIFGLLYGKDKSEEATEIFSGIETRYKDAQKVFGFFTMDGYPTVFTGLSFSGTWYVPGGKSFQAKMLADAWANYVWRHDQNNNSLSLAEETVIDLCLDTDYWVIVSSEKAGFSKGDLIQQNSRYAHFKAARNNNIIFCNSAEKDIFGQAIAEPDIVLSDLIHFFYPGLYKNYTPKYFEKLK